METHINEAVQSVPSSFETNPQKYRHIRLEMDGNVARLLLSIREDEPLVPGYVLKLNSYDLGVDLELADAVQRLRFEHPEVSAVVISSAKDRIFCAGANIHMLAQSSHGFKVNFCKFTNETRLSIEDACRHSGQTYLAAVSGPCAGGGYELAMACAEIVLIDDGSSTVSLPEVPLLGVLPGTGGLTRLVDKRKVRRDRADVFSTLAEGIRGKRAVEWRLVDAMVPRSRFAQAISERAQQAAKRAESNKAVGNAPKTGISLEPLSPSVEEAALRYRFVTVTIDLASRTAHLTMHGPGADQTVHTAQDVFRLASHGDLWALRAFRELDDALCRLRFHYPTVGLVLLHTRGERAHVVSADASLHALRRDWLANEVLLNMARVLRRLDMTAKSFFAVVEPDSCFAGSLLELLLAADRSYVLDDPRVQLAMSPLNAGVLLCDNGLSRLGLRCLDEPEKEQELHARGAQGPFSAQEADEFGFCTVLADDLDFDDTLRLAVEERVSLSPDALTGMEQNLRFPGPDTMPGKVFGRLSAWQNWIFIRENATGARGALKSYGKPERPSFDFRRT